MTIGANSYGSVSEVVALTRRYTDGGSYTATTRPTLTEVEKFIDRVSAIVNLILTKHSFTIPISQATCKLVLDEFVTTQAAQLCHAANGAGPYAPGSPELNTLNRTPFEILRKEAEGFIASNANAFKDLGAARSQPNSYGLGCRTTDDSGETIEPVFQRKQFDTTNVDWDAS